MKKKLIAGIILIIIISGLFAVAIHVWNSRYDGQMIRQMNCGLTSSDAKIELLQEERGGLTGDGTAIYKVSINENYDTSELDVSGWKSLPIDEEIVDYYMVNEHSAGRTISKLQKGNWKKNIYMTDPDGNDKKDLKCFYHRAGAFLIFHMNNGALIGICKACFFEQVLHRLPNDIAVITGNIPCAGTINGNPAARSFR